MNQQDKSFLITFTTVMSVLVLIAVAIFMVAQLVSKVGVVPTDTARMEATIEDRIKPVALVNIAATSAEASALPAGSAPAASAASGAGAQPGAEVYANVCTACHAAGVLGAPKAGSKEDWTPRYEQGLDTLVSNAVNGIRQMPAKGGNPSLTEEQIHDAIVYMLQESGIEVEGGASGETVAATESAPPAALDLAKGKEVYSGICMACHMSGAAGAPMLTDKAAWETRAQQGMDTLVSHAVNGFNAMPAKGGNPALSDDDIRNAIGYMLSEAGVEVATSTAAAPAETQAPAAEQAPAPAPAVQTEATATAAAPAAPGGSDNEAVLQAITALRDDIKGVNEEISALRKEVELLSEQTAKGASTPAPAAEESPPTPQAPAEEKPAAPQAAAPAVVEQAVSVAAVPTAEQATAVIATTEKGVPENQPPAVEQQVANVAVVDLDRGKQLYNTACIICHQNGVAGAPKFADKDAWAPRIANGIDNLIHHALNGYKGMPAKGGRMDVPDDEIIAAVTYMIENVK